MKSQRAAPDFTGGWSGKAGRVDHAAHRLHDEVHGRIVAVGTVLAVTRARAVDEPRVDLLQLGRADAEAVHHARGEVLDEDVGARTPAR